MPQNSCRKGGSSCGSNFYFFSAVLLGCFTWLQAVAEITAQAQAGCSGCQILRTQVAILGSENDEISAADIGPFPERLSNGNTIARTTEPWQFAVFDRNGKFLRTLGRRGGGPGEFRIIGTYVVGVGDSMYVYQPKSITVLAPSGQYIRTIHVEGRGVTSLIRLRSGEFIASMVSQPEGKTLATLASDGSRTASFEATSKQPSCVDCRSRVLTGAKAPNQFHAVSWRSYEIETWSSSGKLESTIQVQSNWLPPGSTVTRSVGAPPLPRLTALHLDSQGRLWAGGNKANSRWKRPETSARVGGSGVVRLQAAAANLDVTYYDSFIDVVDPTTGTVLASQRFPGELLVGLGEGHAYTQRESADGTTRIHVWELKLALPQQRP